MGVCVEAPVAALGSREDAAPERIFSRRNLMYPKWKIEVWMCGLILLSFFCRVGRGWE